MTSLFDPALILHITCGLAACVVGLAPIFTRKGSRLHRLWGKLFVGLMAVLLACAWLMTVLQFSPYFLALSATATMTLFSGVRVLGRKRPDLRRADRAKALDWIVTLGVVGVGAWVLVLVVTGQTGDLAAVSSALAYGALVYGVWDLWRFARPTDWPFSPNLWNYEHLTKMLGAYGAVLSAFSGNFLTFLPAPWSQLWPTFLFQTVTLIWIAVLIVRRRRSPAFG
ncbi:hypothetical protein [Brevundimonas sp.]|uniref:hypothetical protein n=1 Tax=Brevundimonas sp. TaxID=1871086 RepID=UPI00261A0808|nr:hypothetical protein [Brevundimonas sp.]